MANKRIRKRKKENFHSMYTLWWARKMVRDYSHQNVYKHWNSWCVRGGNGLYYFEDGYQEDYVKYKYKKCKHGAV